MKSHVVVIMADQLRYDVLGCGFTPNIDSIKAAGVSFERAYTASPLCVPARGSFFTGLCPNRSGSLINPWEPADAVYGNVKAGIDNLYTLLEQDWDSIHSGKQHLFTTGGKLEQRRVSPTSWASTEGSYKEYLKAEGVPLPGGASYRSRVPEMIGGKITKTSSYSNAHTGCYEAGEHYYFDAYFAERAVAAMRNRDQRKPLLLNAMFLAPHPPLQIPQPWYGMIDNSQFTMPDNVGVFYPCQSPLQMYNLTGVTGAQYDRPDWKEPWRVYLGLVSMLDDCVGQILKELKDQGIYDDSLILFTSDHGEMLGSHGLFQKMCMYEESSRVPLYMKFPSSVQPVGNEFHQAVSHLDVLPTLCDYLEVASGNQMDGISLLPLIMGDETAVNEKPVFIQYDGNGSRSNFQRCIVRGKYKLIVDLFKDEVYYELYDVLEDPQEKENLLFQPCHDDIARELESMLSLHMKVTGDLIGLPPFWPWQFRKNYDILMSHDGKRNLR